TGAASPDIAIQLRALSATPEPAKLWARDFAAYATSNAGQWLVARSKEPCLSETEAASQAHADAARLVWPLALSRFASVPPDTEWLRARIDRDVIAGRLDADKLAEKFDRPYGAVWTEAILLDASPSRIDSLISSYKSDRLTRQRHETRSHAVLLVGIA